MDEQMTDAEVLRQLDEANKYRDIIIDVLPRITQDAADDMSLRICNYVAAQLAERDAEIERLRAQVAELQQWKAAVPVVGIKRLFRDAPYDASYADEVWQWIEKYTLNR